MFAVVLLARSLKIRDPYVLPYGLGTADYIRYFIDLIGGYSRRIFKNIRYCLRYSLLYLILFSPHALEASFRLVFPPVYRIARYQSRISGHREPGLHVRPGFSFA